MPVQLRYKAQMDVILCQKDMHIFTVNEVAKGQTYFINKGSNRIFIGFARFSKITIVFLKVIYY